MSQDVVCTLRDDFHDAARMRVRQWVNAYAKLQGLTKFQGQQVNKASRTTVDNTYFSQMYRAKIIVTVNPAGWEGDFRFMEAVASGALIFVGECFVNDLANNIAFFCYCCVSDVCWFHCEIFYIFLLLSLYSCLDYMYAPRPHPMLDGAHVVYYDNDNKTDLFVKLDYYRQAVKVARKIAINGYLHAMKYHRSVNLLDYVLRSVHIKLVQDEKHDFNVTLPYEQTGFDMHRIARKFGQAYKTAGKERMRLIQKDYEL